MILYCIQNMVNGKLYIGQAVHHKRWHTHLSYLRKGKHHNGHLQSSFNKHGENAFEFEILESHPTQASINEAEKFYISYLRCCGARLFNVMSGGDVAKMSMEARRKISIANTGKKLSPELRLRFSLMRKGNISQSTKDAVAKANRERIWRPESIEKMRKTRLGRPIFKNRGRVGFFRGKHHSEEAKMKLSEGQKRYWSELRRLGKTHPRYKKEVPLVG